jgi:hypothetical protein
MKKILFLSIATILFTIAAQAQNTHFGIKAGLNSSNINIINGVDYDSKLGFHAGGLAHIHVNKHFAVQPEITFSTQGGEYPSYKLKLNYINVPVLAQYMFNEGFRVQTGPQVGFMVSAEREEGHEEVDVSNDFSTFDFAWSFGASYLFPKGVGIDARYNLGITDFAESPVYKAKNQVFQVGLFYQFMHNAGTHK